MDCVCEEWVAGVKLLRAGVVLINGAIEAGELDGDEIGGRNFRYCPWCGKELGVEKKTQVVECLGCGEDMELPDPYFGPKVCEKCLMSPGGDETA